MRFGPGVETYPDQHQEVGFWIGTHISRLSRNLTTLTVPSYNASNSYTKIKLLQFRHLINLIQVKFNFIFMYNNEKLNNKIFNFDFSHLIQS